MSANSTTETAHEYAGHLDEIVEAIDENDHFLGTLEGRRMIVAYSASRGDAAALAELDAIRGEETKRTERARNLEAAKAETLRRHAEAAEREKADDKRRRIGLTVDGRDKAAAKAAEFDQALKTAATFLNEYRAILVEVGSHRVLDSFAPGSAADLQALYSALMNAGLATHLNLNVDGSLGTLEQIARSRLQIAPADRRFLEGGSMSPDDTRRARKAARAKIAKAVSESGLSLVDEKWFDLILEGVPALDAAKSLGISRKTAAIRLTTPSFLAEIARRVGAIRTIEGPRNLHVLRVVRDRALDPGASAAQQRVSIDAARLIEGESGKPGATFHVGIKIGPGLVVDLSDDTDDHRMIDVTPAQDAPHPPSHLMDHVDFGDDDVGEVTPEDPQRSRDRPPKIDPSNPFAPYPGGFKGRSHGPEVPAPGPVRLIRRRAKPRG